MRGEAAGLSHVGLRRRQNEDSYLVAPELGLYLVADGLGGHRAGRRASQLAARIGQEAIAALQDAPASLPEKLHEAVLRSNRAIWEEASGQGELEGMGTTLVALLAEGGRAALAHVGDSRAYQVRAGSILQLTQDHSLVGDLLRRKALSAEEAREHPQRNVLTRALGTRAEVEPDVAELALPAGDAVVLCSDGLTNLVRDEEIRQAVCEAASPAAACQTLVDRANSRGGDDNVTVVVVTFV